MSDDAVILVVDDEHEHADGIAEALEKVGAKTIAVYSGRDALEIIRSEKLDVVVTDLKLDSDIDGLDILEEAKKQNSQTEVILITAYATIDTCKEAIKQGAYDYLVKPIDIDQLRTLVEQACRRVCRSHSRGQRNGKAIKEHFEFDGVRGTNPAMEGIFKILRRVAQANISVFVQFQSWRSGDVYAGSTAHPSVQTKS